MPAWVFDGFDIPAEDSPLFDSVLPSEQEDEHVMATPLGASTPDATVVQYVGTPSIGANSPAQLTGYCSLSTKTQFLARKRRTILIQEPWDTTGRWWYVLAIRMVRWSKAVPLVPVIGEADQRFIYTIKLLGRAEPT